MLLECLVAAAMLSAPTNEGKNPQTVLVEAACPDAADVAAVLDAVQERLTARGDAVQRVAPARRAHCWVVERERVREHLRLTTQAFEKVELERAKLEAGKALRVFLDNQSLLDAPGLYVETRMMLGWLELELRQKSNARNHFGAVAAIDPSFAPSHDRYPPAVYEELQDAVSRLQREKITIEITSSPEGALVRVSGRDGCRTPCRLARLPRGAYFFAAELDGHQAQRRLVRLQRSSSVELAMLPLEAPSTVADAKLAVRPAAEGMLRVHASGVAITSRELEVSTQDAGLAAERIVGLLEPSAAGALPNGVTAPPPPPAAATVSSSSFWWPWGVALGAALAVGAGYLAYELAQPATVDVRVSPPGP